MPHAFIGSKLIRNNRAQITSTVISRRGKGRQLSHSRYTISKAFQFLAKCTGRSKLRLLYLDKLTEERVGLLNLKRTMSTFNKPNAQQEIHSKGTQKEVDSDIQSYQYLKIKIKCLPVQELYLYEDPGISSVEEAQA